ncbi:protein LURP-one-related 15 [Sesamum alatum]|uniref:Protein LURP-one-related 15 n=1 Tax=Sesamum alatum TaxID=300844 RepID=A0AAE1XVP8_9LAMI|nr:protein LURP-one-related 15 [Sesamum alatum]
METRHGKMNCLTAVISPQFCVPGNVHLTTVRKPTAFTNGKFKVTDGKGNCVFYVKEKMLSIHGRLLLLDSGSNPIVTFKKKILSAHRRWQVFRGDSSDYVDLLFTTKNSSLVQFKIELDVFLASNEGNSSWDFKVVGNWVERSCIVYDKDSTPVAQIQKKRTFGGIVLGKDTLNVTVYSQVDYAFIVALILILYEIKQDTD